jgi:hypothetical protein
LWRQQIQDHLIATIQNVRILLGADGAATGDERGAGAGGSVRNARALAGFILAARRRWRMVPETNPVLAPWSRELSSTQLTSV